MMEIYVGVTFDCRLPDKAVNTKIKQVISLLSAYFNGKPKPVVDGPDHRICQGTGEKYHEM